MALAVDSFDLLFKEISSTLSKYTTLDLQSFTWKDWLAIIGALYVAGKSLRWCRRAYNTFKVYGLARLSHEDLVKTYGSWAVVTGCTAGIGEAFVTELASCGVNVILISRTQSRLEELAQYCEKNFGVKTCVIAVDFNEGRSVYDKIKDGLKGKSIGILVNNVGVMYDYPQLFLDVPEEKLWQLVHVNVAAATMMTHIVLPGMVERKKGAIITVSSGSCLLPTPQMTVYSATKAYLDFFMRALMYEYKDQGITVQCLMPFYVATRMTRYSPTLSNPTLLIPSAAAYARQALSTLGWSSRTEGYWPHTMQSWFLGLVPENLWLWGATRLNNALRRQAFHRIRHRSGGRASNAGDFRTRSGSIKLGEPRSRSGSSVSESQSFPCLASDTATIVRKISQSSSVGQLSQVGYGQISASSSQSSQMSASPSQSSQLSASASQTSQLSQGNAPSSPDKNDNADISS